MKGREWERLARREILPILGPNYTVRGSLIHRWPIDHILLGVNAETMYEATRMTLQAVVTPLYQPDEALTYFIPRKLGATDVEEGRVPSAAVDLILGAVPFLDSHATPELLLGDPSWRDSDDVVRLEVKGYSYLLTGDLGAAREVLAHASRLETNPERGWEEDIQRRCGLVLGLMTESPEKARAQLVEWEDQTLIALRLTRDC